VSVALVIQHAKAHAQYYIVVCGLSDCTVFNHIVSLKHDYGGKVVGREMCFDFHDKFCLKRFSFQKISEKVS